MAIQQQPTFPPERELSEAVVKAVQAVYAAKTATEKITARSGEREAVKALDAYRKERGYQHTNSAHF